jgi:two-component system, NarL family, sensor histidine kinase DegS
MQEQLRHLSHQLLSAQEEERKTISRELHDEIAQTLSGINVQLTALKAAAKFNNKDLQKKITSTQRLVEKSVRIVHRFARELRPSALDDLGLIPALHSFVKAFAERTHLSVRLRIFAGVEEIDLGRRTVLYRVAQEALTNVARHAKATAVQLCIEELPNGIHMEIKDNGRSFPVQRTLRTKMNKRLGLLGMRERVEMVGGAFNIESRPNEGTTIDVNIPFRHVGSGRKRRQRSRG